MSDALPLRVLDVRLLERPVRLRLPFRYGAVTLREAPQAFARVLVRCRGRERWGTAAELLAPKWFDKDPALSDERNFDQLRASLARAAHACLGAAAGPAFDLALEVRERIAAPARAARDNGLVAGFGPAMLERAVLDALGRIAGTDLGATLRAGLAGVRLEALAPDLADFDGDGFLAGLAPRDAIEARHTVGLLDPLHDAEIAGGGAGDGLPESLEAVITRYGNRWFKIKLGGETAADLARLRAVQSTLARTTGGRYRVSLDGNERYDTVHELAGFLDALRADPALGPLRCAVVFLEQPLRREVALNEDLGALGCPFPLVIDESDDAPGAFLAARDRGYRGVSSKQCKGLYKSLANAARCAAWNSAHGDARFFLTAEDLTCQGGIAVQQDLALASVLGVSHAERNGHHFGGPMPGAPRAEHRAFLDAHPDLYRDHGGRACLRIERGRIALGSLACPGLAHAADPELASMQEMTVPGAGAGVACPPSTR